MLRLVTATLAVAAFGQDERVSNQCFQVSSIKGTRIRGSNFKSDLNTLKQYFRPNMRMRRVRLCGDHINIDGVQGFLVSWENELALNFYGTETTCMDWTVPDGSYIAMINFSYGDLGLNYISFSTELNISFQMGSFRPNDRQFSQTFEKNDPVVGFAGYEGSSLGNVNQLGFYKYKCAIEGEDEPPPPPEPATEEEEDPEEEAEPIFEEEEEEEMTQTIVLRQAQGPDLDLIISVAIGITFFMLLVAFALCYSLARHRAKTQVSQNEETPQGAQIEQSEVSKKGSESKHGSNIPGINVGRLSLESGLELGGLQLPGLISHRSLDSEVSNAAMKYVPSDVELKNMLRGKTKAERKQMLQEIDRQKQAQLQLTVMMEQQAIKNEERWQARNFQERQDMLRLLEATRSKPRPTSGNSPRSPEKIRIPQQQQMSATFYSNRSSMRKKKPLGTSDTSPTELVSRNLMQGTKTDFKSIFYLKPDPKEDEEEALEDKSPTIM